MLKGMDFVDLASYIEQKEINPQKITNLNFF
jgi:hypothetical protein